MFNCRFKQQPYFTVGGLATPSSVTHSSLNYWLHVLSAGTCLFSSLFGRAHAHVFCWISGEAANQFKFSTSSPPLKKKNCTTDCGSQHLVLSHNWVQSCACAFLSTCTQMFANSLLAWVTGLHQHSEQVVKDEYSGGGCILTGHNPFCRC